VPSADDEEIIWNEEEISRRILGKSRSNLLEVWLGVNRETKQVFLTIATRRETPG